MYPSLPDVPFAQLDYRSDLLSTEFSANRRRREARPPRRARRVLRWVPVRHPH